ncbi:hypothetical protein [Haladaptatus sp. DFWS20]
MNYAETFQFAHFARSRVATRLLHIVTDVSLLMSIRRENGPGAI